MDLTWQFVVTIGQLFKESNPWKSKPIVLKDIEVWDFLHTVLLFKNRIIWNLDAKNSKENVKLFLFTIHEHILANLPQNNIFLSYLTVI